MTFTELVLAYLYVLIKHTTLLLKSTKLTEFKTFYVKFSAVTLIP